MSDKVETNVERDCKSIVETAREYINTPLADDSGKGGYTTRSTDTLERNPCVYVEGFWRTPRRECHVYLQRISGWLPPARTNKDLRDRFDALYRKLDERPIAAIDYIINCEDDLRDLIVKNRLSVICGKRGSGKTAALNYWLSLYGEAKLAKENGVAWFKIDASNIYEIWEAQGNEGKHLCEYVQLYISSDFLFHSRCLRSYEKYKSDLFCAILRELKKDPNCQSWINTAVLAITERLEQEHKHPRPKVVSDNTYQDGYAFASGDIIHLITLHALLHDDVLRTNLKKIYGVLSAALRYKQKLTALIIDGIDSIETVRPQHRYQVLIEQVGNLISCCNARTANRQNGTACSSRDHNLCEIDKNLRITLVIRPETLEDVKKQIHFSYDNFGMDSIPLGMVVPPQINSILKKKFDAVRFSDPLREDREKIEGVLKEDPTVSPEINTAYGKTSSWLREYENFFTKYKTMIKACVDKTYANARSTSIRTKIDFRPSFDLNGWSKASDIESNIVRYLFNDNIRAFIDNFFHTKLLTSYLKLSPGISRVEDDPYKYLEYVLFNGRVLLNTGKAMTVLERGNPIRRGECFPNVFWFDPNEKQWGGLTGIRILQFLKCFNGDRGYAASYMLSTLKTILNLDSKHLWNTYRRLVEYGLVDVMPANGHSRDIPEFSQINGRSKLTKKGKFFLDFSFIYPQWIYACAIDTPMPDCISNSQYMPVYEFPIGSCIESDSAPDSYLEAFMVTLATFARVIKDKHAQQIRMIDDVIRIEKVDMSKDDVMLLRKYMELPPIFEEIIINDIKNCAERRAIRNYRQFGIFKTEYFDNIFRKDIESTRNQQSIQTKTTSGGHALVIGISKYEHIPCLPENVANDARRFTEIVTDGNCGYPIKNVCRLVNGEATAKAIRAQLRLIAKSAARDETILVFFSGHGGRISSGGAEKVYLLPADYDPKDPSGTALESSELISLLNEIQSNRVVIFIDACHSGGAGVIKDAAFAKGLTDANLKELSAGSGRVILSSSKHDEISYVFSDMKYSLFSYFLFEKLNKINSQEEPITVLDVFKHVSEHVPTEAQRRGVEQTPRFLADMTKDFPLAAPRSRSL